VTLHYVPAGAYPNYTSSSLIYWRKLPVNEHDFSKPAEGFWMEKESAFRVRAADRELLICTRPDRWRPCLHDYSWEGCFNTSLYQKGGLGERYIKHALFSAHNCFKTQLWTRNFLTSDHVKIMADSGGAQVKARVTPYIDPKEVIKWSNHVADYVMSVDLCPSAPDVMFNDVVKACAKIQKQNNEVFKKYKKDSLKLINVIHGHTLEQQMDFWKRVRDPEFVGWAAGPDNWNSPLSWIQALMIPMIPTINALKHGEQLPKESEIFHLFGCTGRSTVPMLAWVGKFVPTLTVDSTSWLYAARTKTMEVQTPSGALRAFSSGASGGRLTKYQPIACSCEICSIVRYSAIYDMDERLRMTGLLGFHNLISMANYITTWNRAAETMTKTEYCDNIDRYLRKSKALENRTVIDYVETVVEEGVEKASKYKTYRDLLNRGIYGEQDTMEEISWGDTDHLYDNQEETLKRLSEESEKTESYYKDLIKLKPETYYKYQGHGKDFESVSVYSFPYYLKPKEIEDLKLSTFDRIKAFNYLALSPEDAGAWEYKSVARGRRRIQARIKRRKLIPPGLQDIPDWLTPAIQADRKTGVLNDDVIDVTDDEIENLMEMVRDGDGFSLGLPGVDEGVDDEISTPE
jgi:hypothetical protein